MVFQVKVFQVKELRAIKEQKPFKHSSTTFLWRTSDYQIDQIDKKEDPTGPQT